MHHIAMGLKPIAMEKATKHILKVRFPGPFAEKPNASDKNSPKKNVKLTTFRGYLPCSLN
jgi:hypothetical protein